MRYARFSAELTAKARLKDPRSKIGLRWDGTERVVLKGRDKSALRKACLARDNFTCSKCGSVNIEENLDMHHIEHLGKGGSDSLDNVTTRCKWGDCHRGEHVQVMSGKIRP